jgi:hypothetical protein
MNLRLFFYKVLRSKIKNKVTKLVQGLLSKLPHLQRPEKFSRKLLLKNQTQQYPVMALPRQVIDIKHFLLCTYSLVKELLSKPFYLHVVDEAPALQ